MAEAMPITPAVVTWARERAGFSMDAAISDFRKIVEWEAGEAFPSYPQLEKMAEKFKGRWRYEPPRVYWRVKLSQDGPYDTEKIYPELHG